MNEVKTTRNTWVACPKCGHKVAKVRTCDMEMKCKHCGCEFEAVINLSKITNPPPKKEVDEGISDGEN